MRLGLLLIVLSYSASALAQERDLFAPYEKIIVTRIEYTGNNVTKDYVITRELHTLVGQPFSWNILQDDLQRLDNLGIFSSIEVVPSDYEGGVGLELRFRELPWLIPYLKFKFTEENGWSIGPTVTSVNMFGRDIYLSGFALFGGTTQFSAKFTWPWITGNHVSLDATGEHLSRANELYTFDEASDEITPWVGMYLGETGRLRGTISYFAIESDRDSVTLSPDKRDDMIRIGAAIGYDRRDAWQNPHEGWELELEVMKTGGFLGGDGDFTTTTVDVRRYQPLFDQRQTLSLGFLTSLRRGTVGTDIPIYMQYNMGGANTIRGYDINELGVRLFGKNQAIFTAEYDYLLMPIREYIIIKWPVTFGLEASAFLDFGTAWSTSAEFNSDRRKLGYGIGLRALVPGINVARFDLGISEEGDFMFHLGLWPKFDAQRLRLR